MVPPQALIRTIDDRPGSLEHDEVSSGLNYAFARLPTFGMASESVFSERLMKEGLNDFARSLSGSVLAILEVTIQSRLALAVLFDVSYNLNLT